MIRIAIVEHEANVSIERLGPWLEAAGAELTVFRPYLPISDEDPTAGRLPRADQIGRRLGEADFDALMVLGGSMDPDADADHPWLPEARDLLGKSAAGDYPSLNVCLGGQMLSIASGAGIRHRERPQAGALRARLTAAAADDPLFSQLPEEFPLILWHGIEMQLPQGATHLVEGTDSPVQAYRLGEAWGLQFHPETSAEQAEDWASGTTSAEFLKRAGVKPAEAVEQITAVQDETADVMSKLAEAFVSYVSR